MNPKLFSGELILQFMSLDGALNGIIRNPIFRFLEESR